MLEAYLLSKMAQLNGAASTGLVDLDLIISLYRGPNVAKCANSSDPNWVGWNPHQANFHRLSGRSYISRRCGTRRRRERCAVDRRRRLIGQ